MKKTIISACVVGALFFACEKNAITGRRSLNLIPESEMIGMSLTQYKQFLDSNKVQAINM